MTSHMCGNHIHGKHYFTIANANLHGKLFYTPVTLKQYAPENCPSEGIF